MTSILWLNIKNVDHKLSFQSKTDSVRKQQEQPDKWDDLVHLTAFIPKAMINGTDSGRSSGSPYFPMPSHRADAQQWRGFGKFIKGLQLRVQLRSHTGFPFHPGGYAHPENQIP